MIIIEPKGLPAPIIAALKASIGEYAELRKNFLSKFHYDEEFSVTDLTRPVRQFWLYRRHRENFVIDLVKDNWKAFQGTIVHFILENYADPDDMVEERQYVFLSSKEGKKILFHGCPDHYSPKTKHLTDYKYTSARGMLYGPKEEYIFQLNANKYLLDSRGYAVDSISNTLLFRDWSKKDQREYAEKYPDVEIVDVPYKPWDRQLTENKILERIELLLKHKDTEDDKLPGCTADERWNRTARYMVHKKLKRSRSSPCSSSSSAQETEWGKRAWKSADTEEEAYAIAATATEETRIEFNQGTNVRCEDWCHANRFCGQYHRMCKASASSSPSVNLDPSSGFSDSDL